MADLPGELHNNNNTSVTLNFHPTEEITQLFAYTFPELNLTSRIHTNNDVITSDVITSDTVNTTHSSDTEDTSPHWSDYYLNHVHGPLLLTLGLLGMVFCVVNIIVLTRRRMRTPLNFVLTAIAVIDLLEFYSHAAYAAYW